MSTIRIDEMTFIKTGRYMILKCSCSEKGMGNFFFAPDQHRPHPAAVFQVFYT